MSENENTQSAENETVLIDGQELTLAELAGVDMTDVQEVRFSVTPAGFFHWRIESMELKSKEILEDYDDPDSAMINIPVVDMELKAVNCLALVDDTLDTGDYVGITHYKTFKIQDLKKGLGRVKAFLVDIGLSGNSAMIELLDEAHGMEFCSEIAHTKNRNNPDIIFANINNVITIEAYQEANSD